MATIGFISTNKLMTSPYAYEILREYNARLQRDGKVNKLAFHREVILPKIPDYKQISWYCFLRRAYDKIGSPNLPVPLPDGQQLDAVHGAGEMVKTLQSNELATREGISHALNLGAAFYAELWTKYKTDPESLTDFEKKIFSDSMFKAMKAQDSRIHALGKVRQDNRDQARFERAFGESVY